MSPNIKSFGINRRMESIECLNAGDEACPSVKPRCSTAGRRETTEPNNSVWWGFSPADDLPAAHFVTRKEVRCIDGTVQLTKPWSILKHRSIVTTSIPMAVRWRPRDAARAVARGPRVTQLVENMHELETFMLPQSW